MDLSRSAVKSHVLASFQTLHRLRDELLAGVKEGRLDGLVSLQQHLIAEVEWLTAAKPRVDARRKAFLHAYAVQVLALMTAINVVATQRPIDPARFRRVGVMHLALLAHEQRARREL